MASILEVTLAGQTTCVTGLIANALVLKVGQESKAGSHQGLLTPAKSPVCAQVQVSAVGQSLLPVEFCIKKHLRDGNEAAVGRVCPAC